MNINSKFDYTIRFALLGDSKVGKTNMITRFVDDVFNLNCSSTMGYDCKYKIITLKKKKVKVMLWDTVGQEKFLAINKAFLQKVDGIMLVYDISELESFQNMNRWISMIRDYNDKLPTILVGNKKDKEEERIVSEDEGKALAEKNHMHFFETSAYKNINIDKAFYDISQKIFDYLMNESKTPSDNFTLDKKKESEKKKKNKCC